MPTDYRAAHLAIAERDRARDDAAALADLEDTCGACGHADVAHGRSGCFECSCVDHPGPYDPWQA